MRTGLSLGLLSVVLAATACSADPISYSGPVAIELKVDSDKVVNDSISTEKGITTENGNPYGAFISDAQAAIGADPSRIEIHSAEIYLGADTTGVSSLAEVFDGQVDVLFQVDTTNDSFDAGFATIGSTTDGRGPVTMSTSFDSDQMSAASYAQLMTGSFKVVLSSPTQADFDTLSAKTTVQVTFDFDAFE